MMIMYSDGLRGDCRRRGFGRRVDRVWGGGWFGFGGDRKRKQCGEDSDERSRWWCGVGCRGAGVHGVQGLGFRVQGGGLRV